MTRCCETCDVIGEAAFANDTAPPGERCGFREHVTYGTPCVRPKAHFGWCRAARGGTFSGPGKARLRRLASELEAMPEWDSPNSPDHLADTLAEANA